MSKNKAKLTPIDFDTGVGLVIPATQEAHTSDGFDGQVRKVEKEALVAFKRVVGDQLDSELAQNGSFPTDGEVFVFIVQYFGSGKEYVRRDVDNMAKTILDLLRNRFYMDDSQVKTLLVGKKIEARVPQNFAYIAVKKLSATQDVDALKISGLERSITMFQELKSRKVL
ncbi:MAG: RusA family crossover junction endodeoxyribonuclease [bacterium]|nr:RusA family crossover junction endodeoxyribonuclease [bacterium]